MQDGMRRRIALVLSIAMALLVAGPLGPAPLGARIARADDLTMELEAKRQLDFAREELAKQEWERALKSADSALKLNPSLYEAFVVKALCYEGLGDLRLAESLLLAYSDVTAGLQPSAEADEALARIRGVLAEEEKGGGRKAAKAEKPEKETKAESGAGSENPAKSKASDQSARKSAAKGAADRDAGKPGGAARATASAASGPPKPPRVVLGILSGLLLGGGAAAVVAGTQADAARRQWASGGQAEAWGYPPEAAAAEYRRAETAMAIWFAGGGAGLGLGAVGMGVTLAWPQATKR
jgi:hypothetical protein